MSTKKCNTCSIEKPLHEYNKWKDSLDGHGYKCKKCIKEYSKQRYLNNKEYYTNYHNQNKERILETRKKWRKDNPNHSKTYHNNNPNYWNVYRKERRKNDPLFKLKANMRSRLSKIMKNKGWVKKTTTIKTIGCDWDTLKHHLETQFDDKMNWDNYGSYWEVDHIKPMASAKTVNEAYELNHYTNLQPLYWEENRQKSDKLNYKNKANNKSSDE